MTMKLRKPEKQMQIYWSKRELELITAAINEKMKKEYTYVDHDVLRKCALGIEALDAYVRGDEAAHELLEVCRAQNETEPMV